MISRFRLPLLLAALVTLSAGLATRGQAAEVKPELEGGAAYAHLNNGSSDWTGLYAESLFPIAKYKKLYGSLKQVTQFDISDGEARVGGFYPLAKSTIGMLEGRVASPGEIFSKSTLFAKVEQLMGKGWVLQGGLKHQSFSDAEVDMGILTAERYFGSFRAGYTMHIGVLEGSHSAVSHIGTFSSYYGRRNSVTVIASKGREIELVLPPANASDSTPRVASFDTYSLSFWGRHWFTSHWGWTYSAGYREQGNSFDIFEFKGGIRYGY